MNLLTEHSPRYQPIHNERYTIVPKEHQKACLHQMKELETYRLHFEPHTLPLRNGNTRQIPERLIETKVGILNDAVGYGKTITMLLHLSENGILPIFDRYINRHHDYTNRILIYEKEQHPELFLPMNLIIVPKGVFHQWEHTLKNLVKLPFKSFNMNKDFEDIKKINYETYTDILLINENRLKTWYQFMIAKYQYSWIINRLIIDEIDTISVPNFPNISSRFTWFITGSLYVIANPSSYATRTGFIRDVLSNMGETSHYIRVRNTDEFLQMSHSIQQPIIHRHFILDTSNIRVLRNFIGNDILVAVQAGDIQSAIEKLGIQHSSSTNIVDAVTQSLQKQLHNVELKLRLQNEYQFATELQKKEAIEKTQLKIKEIQQKITDLKERIEEKTCAICYSDIQHPILLQCCNHSFCMECLFQYFRHVTSPRCPLCRHDVDQSTLTYIESDASLKAQSSVETPVRKRKEEIIEELFQKYPDGKWLIASEYDGSFELLRQTLTNANMRYQEPKGSSDVLHSIIDKYKKGMMNVLLLNATRYASGIHLPETTDIIFYHPMKKDIELQIIGRAQRMGRVSPLRIHYFTLE